MTKKQFAIKDMHCGSCAMLIEADLEDAGVKAKCDFGKALLEVEFDETSQTEEKIKNIVKTTGYTLQPL